MSPNPLPKILVLRKRMKFYSSSHFPQLLYTTIAFLLFEFHFSEANYHDYGDALSKSILFFEGQRSGFLPGDQRLNWRGNSGLGDGWMVNKDLTGGYYDAGDNVKFGFPMAFTTTMLAWSVIEFGEFMPPIELRNALVAIKWSTDYLLKTVSQPNRIFVQVLLNVHYLPIFPVFVSSRLLVFYSSAYSYGR